MANQASLAYHAAMQKFFAPEAVAAAPAPAARFDEDLPAMAAQAYALADRLCGHCRIYHSLWPYRRLALDAGQGGVASIERTLAGFIDAGARRVLIAAAADTGLLATVARASAGHQTEITLVDKCPTPVELCRQFAARRSLRFQGRVLDLNDLDLRDFDLVYANSVLQFIAAEHWHNVLVRLRRALRPGGVLVLVFNTATHVSDTTLALRKNYGETALAEMDRRQIPLPDAIDAFRERMASYEREHETHDSSFDDPIAVDDLVTKAGFVLKSRNSLDVSLGIQKAARKLSKRRFLLIAQSPLSALMR